MAPLYEEGVGAYMDDIYVFSDTFEQHRDTVDKLFKRLMACNYTINAKKCQLF